MSALSPAELLEMAEENAEGPRSLALVAIGRLLQDLVDDSRTRTLVVYLQALLANPKPGTDTLAQIEVVASLLEQRLGFAPAGRPS